MHYDKNNMIRKEIFKLKLRSNTDGKINGYLEIQVLGLLIYRAMLTESDEMKLKFDPIDCC